MTRAHQTLIQEHSWNTFELKSINKNKFKLCSHEQNQGMVKWAVIE